MPRRGRGFNPQEVANLKSWGVTPRPDEIEPSPPPAYSADPVRRADQLLQATGLGAYERAVLAQATGRGKLDVLERILRRLP